MLLKSTVKTNGRRTDVESYGTRSTRSRQEPRGRVEGVRPRPPLLEIRPPVAVGVHPQPIAAEGRLLRVAQPVVVGIGIAVVGSAPIVRVARMRLQAVVPRLDRVRNAVLVAVQLEVVRRSVLVGVQSVRAANLVARLLAVVDRVPVRILIVRVGNRVAVRIALALQVVGQEISVAVGLAGRQHVSGAAVPVRNAAAHVEVAVVPARTGPQADVDAGPVPALLVRGGALRIALPRGRRLVCAAEPCEQQEAGEGPAGPQRPGRTGPADDP